MKRVISIFILTAILVAAVPYNKDVYANATPDCMTASKTVYGAYGMQHNLELWMFSQGDTYNWYSKCTHYGRDIAKYGKFCYSSCTIEDNRGVIINKTPRAYASKVGGQYKSQSSVLSDKSWSWRGHAYCGIDI